MALEAGHEWSQARFEQLGVRVLLDAHANRLALPIQRQCPIIAQMPSPVAPAAHDWAVWP